MFQEWIRELKVKNKTVPFKLKLLQFKLKLKPKQYPSNSNYCNSNSNSIFPRFKIELLLRWYQTGTSTLLKTVWIWKKVCNILKPLQELTLLLQGENAGVSMANKAVKFLKHLMNSDPALNCPINILKKHFDGNSIVDAIMYKHGEFYEHLKSLHQLQAGSSKLRQFYYFNFVGISEFESNSIFEKLSKA